MDKINNKKDNIAAGIVLYYPDEKRLIKNINNIERQVSKIYIYNNGIRSDIKHKMTKIKNIEILGNGENVGLSKALNFIMQKAYEDGNIDWLVTFDQDSVAPNNLIDTFFNEKIEDDVAIISPQIIDKRRIYMKPNKTNTREYINMCITSSSCTRLKAWKEVGKFDEKLFIDLIDNDFCKRLILSGWKIVKVNSIVLDQQFGNIEQKAKWKVDLIMFFSSKIKNKNLSTNIAKLTYKKNVSIQRVYYTNRNIIYLNKKFKKYGGIGYECYSCNTYIGFLITFCLASFVRGKHKFKILKAIFKGIIDGKRLEVEEFILK